MAVHNMMLSILSSWAGLDAVRGRYNWKGLVAVSGAVPCVLWLVFEMAGLHSGLSAVLSLSGSDSGRSVIEADSTS